MAEHIGLPSAAVLDDVRTVDVGVLRREFHSPDRISFRGARPSVSVWVCVRRLVHDAAGSPDGHVVRETNFGKIYFPVPAVVVDTGIVIKRVEPSGRSALTVGVGVFVARVEHRRFEAVVADAFAQALRLVGRHGTRGERAALLFPGPVPRAQHGFQISIKTLTESIGDVIALRLPLRGLWIPPRCFFDDTGYSAAIPLSGDVFDVSPFGSHRAKRRSQTVIQALRLSSQAELERFGIPVVGLPVTSRRTRAKVLALFGGLAELFAACLRLEVVVLAPVIHVVLPPVGAFACLPRSAFDYRSADNCVRRCRGTAEKLTHRSDLLFKCAARLELTEDAVCERFAGDVRSGNVARVGER